MLGSPVVRSIKYDIAHIVCRRLCEYQAEHSRHRCVPTCVLNIISGLTVYALQPKKPAVDISFSGWMVF